MWGQGGVRAGDWGQSLVDQLLLTEIRGLTSSQAPVRVDNFFIRSKPLISLKMYKLTEKEILRAYDNGLE